MAMAAAQLYASVAAPRRSFVPSNGLGLSLSTPRVLRYLPMGIERTFKNPSHGAPKLSVSMCIRENSTKSPGFEANTAVTYNEDQTHESPKTNFTAEPVDETMTMDKAVAPPPKRSAKIHDFCFGIPFGGFLFSMGLIGYLLWRSPVSLVLGVAPGFTIFLLGVLSLKVWRSGISSVPFILGQAALSSILTWQYSKAYNMTKKILPWGFYAFLSGAMLCFYTYVMLAGGNPPPKKQKLAAASPS
ncbi:Protein FATTY ACID EXPORT 1, chloroplastic [Ananas comosus]|uniref:Protein FATTY ACID EXPORT 1, chloroplastic n=1 Tax=Ananas comosus TaxID=4615 RepID=A0A199VD48_ANACO|nr:Protein FATTY ACID EXPORT 1, chloroplastic [Ananas comosus]